ncbi:hypothetical protein X962_3950 [Burkholderia pseudomallei MSHR7343]|nr:hypothetical protein X962_3950 [Burkholderia pseudomallei MSHR7343]
MTAPRRYAVAAKAHCVRAAREAEPRGRGRTVCSFLLTRGGTA